MQTTYQTQTPSQAQPGACARVGASIAAAFRGWMERARLAEQERQMWEAAQRDPRLMAEIRAAQARAGG